MGIRAVRRGATAAVALTIAVSGLALADTTPADADLLTVGNQGSLDLGVFAPGEAVSLQVGITLRCANGVHAERGSTIAVTLESETYEPSGSAVVTPGSIGPIPATWPLDGQGCTSTGVPSLAAATPVGIAFAAPATPGPYTYTFTFARTPDTGISGISGVAFTFDVVEPEPVDITDPVLVGVPADIVVVTADPAGADVTWPAPTATDDTDPSPAVGCAPAAGTRFPVGATTVTCTATDAAGNAAQAAFVVTVRLGSASWGAPLASEAPLTANLGRVVPVKVRLALDGAPVLPADGGDAPRLGVAQLSGCDGTAAAAADLGPLSWADGAWAYRLDTGTLSPGCWRLVASVDGMAVGTADLAVTDAPVGQAAKAATGRGTGR